MTLSRIRFTCNCSGVTAMGVRHWGHVLACANHPARHSLQQCPHSDATGLEHSPKQMVQGWAGSSGVMMDSRQVGASARYARVHDDSCGGLRGGASVAVAVSLGHEFNCLTHLKSSARAHERSPWRLAAVCQSRREQ